MTCFTRSIIKTGHIYIFTPLYVTFLLVSSLSLARLCDRRTKSTYLQVTCNDVSFFLFFLYVVLSFFPFVLSFHLFTWLQKQTFVPNLHHQYPLSHLCHLNYKDQFLHHLQLGFGILSECKCLFTLGPLAKQTQLGSLQDLVQ